MSHAIDGAADGPRTFDAEPAREPSERPSSAPNGHLPTLITCFLHFDVSFMLWVLLGALGVVIGQTAGLTTAQMGLVVAVPILSGSLLRVPLGVLADHLGAKRVGTGMLLFLYVPLVTGWLGGDQVATLLATGAMLGIAGASFAVALPLASRWYPPERQGLAMGVAAAGNSGTVITNLIAPRLAALVGWQSVMALAMLPLTVALACFVCLARESPRATTRRRWRQYLNALGVSDLWWFCAFYAVTFGSYVGLASFLPIFWSDQYGMHPVQAGLLTALVAGVGSVARPIGGAIADRVGGAPLLVGLFTVLAAVYAGVAALPGASAMTWLLAGTMALLGLGNGAVFQMVPQRFRAEIGLATGLVGAVGGLGGFALPIVLAGARAWTGSFALGFLALAIVASGAGVLLAGLMIARRDWRRSCQPEAPGLAAPVPRLSQG